jgi:hypothetical protein
VNGNFSINSNSGSPAIVLDDLFDPTFFAALCEAYAIVERRGLSFSPAIDRFSPLEGAENTDANEANSFSWSWFFLQKNKIPFSYFSEHDLKNLTEKLLNLELLPYFEGGLHLHRSPGNESVIHNDNINALYTPTSFTGGAMTMVQRIQLSASSLELLKLRRRAALVIYLSDTGESGSGGETVFYPNYKQASITDRFVITPRANRAVLFEINSNSFHQTLPNYNFTRRSISIFFHSESSSTAGPGAK